jgi:HlyD family type I secretion membrane fusion protein
MRSPQQNGTTMSNNHIKAPPTASSDWKRPLRRGGGVSLFAVSGIIGWAAFAPLDSAVVAAGVVAVEGSRQIVQHFEGGIVREIHVRDGQHVSEGELLFVFDDTQARASLDTYSAQLDVLTAREYRLLAERLKASTVTFPEELLAKTEQAIQRAVEDERSNFFERKGLRQVQNDVLQNKIATFRREIEGLRSEQTASERQLELIDKELPGLQSLLAKGLVSVSRVSTLERERARLTAVIARSVTDSAKAERNIGDAELQIVQGDVDFQRTTVSDLIDARKQMAEIRERMGVARDILRRLEIKAPQAGVAQARKFATIGAVVRPGDTLVEIAPIDQNLVIRAQIDPKDIDVLHVGQISEVRFPNFKASESPLMQGQIRALSNDRIQDPQNPNLSYFFVEVQADAASMPATLRERIRSGMTAEVIFPTGERSAARYFLQPLTDRLRQSFRER